MKTVFQGRRWQRFQALLAPAIWAFDLVYGVIEIPRVAKYPSVGNGFIWFCVIVVVSSLFSMFLLFGTPFHKMPNREKCQPGQNGRNDDRPANPL